METAPTHFAEIDAKGVVLNVILADQSFIDSGAVGDPRNWVPAKEGEAGVGNRYDRKHKIFKTIQPCAFCWRVRGFFAKLIGRPCGGCPK